MKDWYSYIMWCLLVSMIILFGLSVNPSDRRCKKIILENISKVDTVYSDVNPVYVVPISDHFYHHAYIFQYQDSSFISVFWVKRKNSFYTLKANKTVNINIPYSRYKGRNLDLDLKIIDELSKKFPEKFVE